MYLYIASNNILKEQNKWYIGVSTEKDISRIKHELKLTPQGCVDFIIDSMEALEIFLHVKKTIDSTWVNEDNILVEGDHGRLAHILTQVTSEYERSHPSLRRSFIRWITKVEA